MKITLRLFIAAMYVAAITHSTLTAADSAATQTPGTDRIAIALPMVQGFPGDAAESANALRDLIASYLKGPSLTVAILEAKVASLAGEEARQKGCESLLLVSITRKSGRHKFLNAMGHGAGASSWNLPGGGSVASATARAGAARALQTASSLAQS